MSQPSTMSCITQVRANHLQCLQAGGFASESTRMIKEVKKGKSDSAVQILLFSATFDDKVKTFAHSIVGGAANQVCQDVPCHAPVT